MIQKIADELSYISFTQLMLVYVSPGAVTVRLVMVVSYHGLGDQVGHHGSRRAKEKCGTPLPTAGCCKNERKGERRERESRETVSGSGLTNGDSW